MYKKGLLKNLLQTLLSATNSHYSKLKPSPRQPYYIAKVKKLDEVALLVEDPSRWTSQTRQN